MVGAGDRCPPTAQRTHPSSRGLRAATESLSQCALGDGEAMHVIGKHRGAVTQAAADQALFAWLTPAAYLESVEADAAHGERLHAVVVADPDDGAQVIAECASQFLGRDIGDRGDIVQACQPGAQRVRQRQLAVALGQLLTRPGSSWPRAVVSTRQLPRPAAFARYIAASAPASARSAVPLPTPKIEHQHRAVTVLAPPRCQWRSSSSMNRRRLGNPVRSSRSDSRRQANSRSRRSDTSTSPMTHRSRSGGRQRAGDREQPAHPVAAPDAEERAQTD
jgi:hypothetical protein